MNLALPNLPRAETIGAAAEAKRDSAAMKRILRAVSGKPATGKPAAGKLAAGKTAKP